MYIPLLLTINLSLFDIQTREEQLLQKLKTCKTFIGVIRRHDMANKKTMNKAKTRTVTKNMVKVKKILELVTFDIFDPSDGDIES